MDTYKYFFQGVRGSINTSSGTSSFFTFYFNNMPCFYLYLDYIPLLQRFFKGAPSVKFRQIRYKYTSEAYLKLQSFTKKGRFRYNSGI